MTKPDNDNLPALQREVQRRLGRCILQLQQYERLIKAVVGLHKVSGPPQALERARDARVDAAAGKTLGTLVGELMGSYVVDDEPTPPEEPKTSAPENANWIALQMNLQLPGEEFVRVERDLRDMVQLRNNLVHHFIDQHDLWSPEGCRAAQDALAAAYDRIDRHYVQLEEWARVMERSRQAMSEVLQSEAFKEGLARAATAEKTVASDDPGIAPALRDALGALAVEGWAPVDEAGDWITTRYPEQRPARYGCRSWRQVVHDAPDFELRYLERNGQRRACFRKKVNSPPAG